MVLRIIEGKISVPRCRVFGGSSRRRPFLPKPLSPLPPYPTSRSPAMVRMGRKGVIPTNKQKTVKRGPGVMLFHVVSGQ